MHYYSFNIGDYTKDTMHLTDMEDLAYRRMMDLYYSREKPLPESAEEIARLIRMRTHSECIANVLRDFFVLEDDGYHQLRIDCEISAFQEKSEKAKQSALSRWKKTKKNQKVTKTCERIASAVETQCEGNAKQEPINNKHKTINKVSGRFTPPTLQEVILYCRERQNIVDPNKFINHYEANGWMRGKNKIKDWKACVRTWEENNNKNNHPQQPKREMPKAGTER